MNTTDTIKQTERTEKMLSKLLKEKLYFVANNDNKCIKIKTTNDIFSLLQTDDGLKLIKNNDNFRKIVEAKIIELTNSINALNCDNDPNYDGELYCDTLRVINNLAFLIKHDVIFTGVETNNIELALCNSF